MKTRISYKRVWLLLVFISCCGIILHDLLTLALSFRQFTLFGLLTHLLAWYFANKIGNFFYEKMQ